MTALIKHNSLTPSALIHPYTRALLALNVTVGTKHFSLYSSSSNTRTFWMLLDPKWLTWSLETRVWIPRSLYFVDMGLGRGWMSLFWFGYSRVIQMVTTTMHVTSAGCVILCEIKCHSFHSFCRLWETCMLFSSKNSLITKWKLKVKTWLFQEPCHKSIVFECLCYFCYILTLKTIIWYSSCTIVLLC